MCEKLGVHFRTFEARWRANASTLQTVPLQHNKDFFFLLTIKNDHLYQIQNFSLLYFQFLFKIVNKKNFICRYIYL